MQLVQPSVTICTIVGAISARLRAAVNLVLNRKIVRIFSLPRMALQTGTQCCIYVGPDGEDVEVELQLQLVHLLHFQSFRNPL